MNDKGPEGSSKVLRISGYVLGLIAMALIAFGIYFINIALESMDWTEAKATVTSGSVRWSYIDGARRGVKTEADKQYFYEVTYNYIVNDLPYTSQRYSLGSGSTASSMFNHREDAALELRERYPQGREFSIYYDPEAPYSAVISRGVQWSTYVPVCLGVFFMFSAYLLVRAAKLIESRQIATAA